jgi:hypothetical protein
MHVLDQSQVAASCFLLLSFASSEAPRPLVYSVKAARHHVIFAVHRRRIVATAPSFSLFLSSERWPLCFVWAAVLCVDWTRTRTWENLLPHLLSLCQQTQRRAHMRISTFAGASSAWWLPEAPSSGRRRIPDSTTGFGRLREWWGSSRQGTAAVRHFPLGRSSSSSSYRGRGPGL